MTSRLFLQNSTLHLVGGGYVDTNRIKFELSKAEKIVAADGGARAVVEAGYLPDLVIGDLDSLDMETRRVIPSERIHHIAEQDSTDFDKALRHNHADFFEAHGFMGLRMDHGLAALNVLVRYAHKRCILHAENDVIILCPPKITLELPKTCRVSLFPMAKTTGTSTGLRWPIDDLVFAPWGQSGTSNEALGTVTLSMDEPAMLLILPLDQLGVLRRALANAPSWPDIS